MKNLKIYALLVTALVVFQSCSKDDEADKSIVEADIVGTWTVNNTDTDYKINGQASDDFFSTDAEAMTFELLYNIVTDLSFSNAKFDFKSDNSYSVTFFGESPFDGSWVLKDGIIILDESNDPLEYEVVSVTNSALVLKYSETEQLDPDDDGELDDVESIMTLELTK